MGVGTLVCKSHKQEGKEILWLDAKFVLQTCKNVLASRLDWEFHSGGEIKLGERLGRVWPYVPVQKLGKFFWSGEPDWKQTKTGETSGYESGIAF